MGTLITTVIITLIVLPLVVGSLLKGALVGRKMLKKGEGSQLPGEAPKKDGILLSLGPWALGLTVGLLLFVVIATSSSYTQVEAGTVGG